MKIISILALCSLAATVCFLALLEADEPARQPAPTAQQAADAAAMVANPEYEHWSQFKAGAFAVEKSRTTADGISTELTKTTTLKSLSPEKAVIEIAGVAVTGGKRKTLPTVRQDILAAVTRAEAEAQRTIEGKTAEGAETLTICGRVIETQWTEAKTLDGGVTTTTKGWVSEEIPGRIVKLDLRCSGAMNMRVITELVDYALAPDGRAANQAPSAAAQQANIPITDATNGAAMVANPEYLQWSRFNPGAFAVMKRRERDPHGDTDWVQTTILRSLTPEKAVIEKAVLVVENGEESKSGSITLDVSAKVSQADDKGEIDRWKKTAEGEETLTILGREIETRWKVKEYTAHGDDMWIKRWESDEIPGHTVRTEVRSGDAKNRSVIVELADYGLESPPEPLVADEDNLLRMVRNPEYEHWSQFQPGAFCVMKEWATGYGCGTEHTETRTLKSLSPEKAVIEVELITLQDNEVWKSRPTTEEIPAKILWLEANDQTDSGDKVAEGEEMLTICGHKIETRWTETKATNGPMTTVRKTWKSEAIPGHLVKIDRRRSGALDQHYTKELLDYGLAPRPDGARPEAHMPVPTVPADGKRVANPEYESWARFKPGAFAVLKRRSSSFLIGPDGTEVWTLKSLSSERAVIEIETTTSIDGEETESDVRTRYVFARIPQAEAEDPLGPRDKVAEGQETLTIGGHRIETTWVKQETRSFLGGTWEKTWKSPEVPGGLVKQKRQDNGPGDWEWSTELVDFGLAPDTRAAKPTPDDAKQAPDGAKPKPSEAPEPESTPTTQPA